jgi:hypothetical protein
MKILYEELFVTKKKISRKIFDEKQKKARVCVIGGSRN